MEHEYFIPANLQSPLVNVVEYCIGNAIRTCYTYLLTCRLVQVLGCS